MAMAVVVGNVIGSGIFLKPGNIAADCGNFGLIISVWVFGGVLCILGALCFAELATMLPYAGGLYIYLQAAYGKLIAFLFGWTELILVRPASIGALAVAFAGSLALTFRWSPSSWGHVLLASILICGMTWVNILGVIWGGRVQVVTTAIKAGFLALVALAPLLLIPVAGWTIDPKHYTAVVEARQATLGTQIGAVLLAVMWAYDGWHGVTALAGEVRAPQRNIPLSLFGGIGILIALYVAVNVAYHGVLSMDEMKAAGDHAAEQMLYKLTGPAGQIAMSLVVMCSTLGAINSNLMQAPRITYAMGRDGVFFRALSAVHATYHTPVIAILTTSFLAILLIVATAVGKLAVQGMSSGEISWQLGRKVVASLQDDSIFQLLTNFVIFSASVFYMLAVMALIVLRIRQPDWDRPYRTWGYPLVPIAFLVAYIWFLAQVYSSSPLESRAGVGLILLGIPVYIGYQLWERRRRT
jgi:APA family basic amino acid/polyamine antiporter